MGNKQGQQKSEKSTKEVAQGILGQPRADVRWLSGSRMRSAGISPKSSSDFVIEKDSIGAIAGGLTSVPRSRVIGVVKKQQALEQDIQSVSNMLRRTKAKIEPSAAQVQNKVLQVSGLSADIKLEMDVSKMLMLRILDSMEQSHNLLKELDPDCDLEKFQLSKPTWSHEVEGGVNRYRVL